MDLCRIDLDERTRKEVRLLLVVTLQGHRVARFEAASAMPRRWPRFPGHVPFIHGAIRAKRAAFLALRRDQAVVGPADWTGAFILAPV